MKTGRWYYCPATQKRIGFRLTLKDRIIRWIYLRLKEERNPDVYMVTGYFPPVWIRH